MPARAGWGDAAGPRWTRLALSGWLLWGLTLVAAAWLWSRVGTTAPEPVRRYALEMTGAEAVTTSAIQVLAISADGNGVTKVVAVKHNGDKPVLRVAFTKS